MRDARFWMQEWQSKKYLQEKRESFRMIDSVLTIPPRRVLDIGAGFAYEDQWLQEKYGCALSLLDGDIAQTSSTRDVGFGDAEDFRFYQAVDKLRESWDRRGLAYEFIDASEPHIGGVFDLIFSSLSCGFHYPIETYHWLLVEHATADTVIVFDIRNRYYNQVAKEYRIINIIQETEKYKKCQIKLI